MSKVNIKNITDLQNVPMFHGLTAKELEYLTPCLIEKSFKKDDMIVFSGDLCRGVLIVRSGRIKLSCLSSSGKEQVLETFQDGQTCACHTEDIAWQCPGNVQAATDCSLWFLPIDNYGQLVKNHPRMLKKLNTILASRLCHFSDLIKRISLDAPQERLAKFILDTMEKKNRFPQYPNFTHDEIAQRVGLTRETVTRYLNKFKRSKLITIRSQEITIINSEKLRQYCS
jgi:CRP/FNR family transcriptional regulator